jgi:hypothetical protein
MFNLIPFKNQYKGKRIQPSLEELKAIVEAIKVEHVISTNGKIGASFQQMEEMQQAIKEAKTILSNI